MSIRVLIADDHAPTRAGVRHSLEAGGFVVVAEAPDGEQAVKLAALWMVARRLPRYTMRDGTVLYQNGDPGPATHAFDLSGGDFRIVRTHF